MIYQVEYDLRLLEEMTENLTPYLYENTLFGTVAPGEPALTVGGVLLRVHRFQKLMPWLNDVQQEKAHQSIDRFEKARDEWAVHYKEKIQGEIEARLHNFQQTLKDWLDNPDISPADYPAKATHRTILEHLKDEAQRFDVWNSTYDTQLRQIDSTLRRYLTSQREQFIWGDMLQNAYPYETYWWLYGYPTAEPVC